MDKPDELLDTASSKSLQSKIDFFKTLEKRPEAKGAKPSTPSKGSFKATQAPKTFSVSQRKIITSPKKGTFWSLPIFERPVCFISTEADGKTLHINKDTINQIEQIEAPLVVIGIAGLYRTGKSYLMNCLAGQSKGFALGNTIESKTKGIWAWCRRHPKHEDTVLFLMDTEGLGDIAKGSARHDNTIFTITTLLCNVLVYNMMSVFNQDAVEKLTFITEMSKNISFRNNKCASDRGQDQIGLILPTFVLCLRDFILDLVKDGKEMTADEYLEYCLQVKPGSGSQVDQYNRPRECIRTYFQERKCFTFDRPGEKTVMKRLETASANALSRSFREDTDTFLAYIYSCEAKVLLSSKPVRGKMFATLACAYLEDIRAGGVPDVDDAISVCANIENERIADATILYFRQELKTTKLPILRVDDLNELLNTLQKKTIDLFRAEAVFGAEKFEIRVTAEIEKIWGDFKEHNDGLVRDYCQTKLQKAYDETVGKRMSGNKYKISGGYEDYKKDILKMKKGYTFNTQGFEQYIVQNVLNKFLDDESTNENDILMADKKLSEEDRKKAIEHVQKENQDAQLKQKQLYEQKLEEESKRAAELMQKMEKEREERRKEEDEKLKTVTEQWKTQQLINEKQMEMMKTEKENLIKKLKKEINRLVDNNKMEKLEQKNKALEKELDKKKNRNIISRILNR